MATVTVDVIHSAEELVRNAKEIEVQLDKLRSDFSYQRDVKEELVDEIANNYNVLAQELPLVADRGPRSADGDVQGGLWIINGQHRCKAAQKKGMKTILARVIDLRKVEDPAALEAEYRLMTNKRAGDNAQERFKAQLRAGDPESLDIVKIAKNAGTEINLSPNPDHGINCVSTVEKIYRLDQGVLLKETLSFVADVWGDIGGRNATAGVLKSICWFIEKHSEETNKDRLVERLKSLGYAAWESRSRTTALSMGGAMWVNFYRTLVALYNEGQKDKDRLQWKMRGSAALSEAKAGASVPRRSR